MPVPLAVEHLLPQFGCRWFVSSQPASLLDYCWYPQQSLSERPIELSADCPVPGQMGSLLGSPSGRGALDAALWEPMVHQQPANNSSGLLVVSAADDASSSPLDQLSQCRILSVLVWSPVFIWRHHTNILNFSTHHSPSNQFFAIWFLQVSWDVIGLH